MKNNWVILYSALVFLYAPIYAMASASDESLVNFKIVCKEQSSDCSKAVLQDTKEEFFVQNTPVLTLADIASASVSSQRAPALRVYDIHTGSIMKREENPALLLRLRDSQKLHNITANNLGGRLAIFINDKLIMAPNIGMPIAGDTFKVKPVPILRSKRFNPVRMR